MPGLKHEPLDATIAIGTEDTSSHAVLSVDEKQHDGVQNRKWVSEKEKVYCIFKIAIDLYLFDNNIKSKIEIMYMKLK